jgi:hypothetical protein
MGSEFVDCVPQRLQIDLQIYLHTALLLLLAVVRAAPGCSWPA